MLYRLKLYYYMNYIQMNTYEILPIDSNKFNNIYRNTSSQY